MIVINIILSLRLASGARLTLQSFLVDEVTKYMFVRVQVVIHIFCSSIMVPSYQPMRNKTNYVNGFFYNCLY